MAVGESSGVSLGVRTTHGTSSPSAPVRSERNTRFALWTFAVVEVVAFTIFFQIGLRGWFRWDDWDFLATRTAGDMHGLLVPHTDHWSAVPILTYRVVWQFFGLRFGPYLAMALVLHLAAAALLRAVMRRAGVGPWIATAAASLFALFGAGYETTAQLMALNFGGWPLVLGLLYLILVDHDGAFDRRDWLGLVAGLGALASSGLGVPMVAAVGLATGLRRGSRVALAHTLPLGAVYLAWYFGYSPGTPGASVGEIVAFVANASRFIFIELGQSGVAAIALALLLVGGLWLAWSPLSRAELRVRASLPLGLLFGAVVFFLVTGYGRGGAPGSGVLSPVARSHYMEAAAVMVLPALAVAAQGVARRVPALSLVVPLVFLVGIPGNLAAYEDGVNRQEALMRGHEQMMLSLPRSELAAETPGDLAPEPLLASPATIGWLRSSLASGRVPSPPQRASSALNGEIELRLSLQQTSGTTEVAPCSSPHGPVVRELTSGQHISLRRGYANIALLRGGAWTADLKFGPPFGDPYFGLRGVTLTAVRGPLTLRITPVRGDENSLCG